MTTLEPRDVFERLRQPFPTSSISWRVGSTAERDGKLFGLPLAYIDARDVMDRLDDVATPFGWQCRYSERQGNATVCTIGIRDDTGAWIWKEDGAGETDYEAEKGALSDAFKRAAVRWGIGRYLYDLKSGWIEVEKKGKTAVIPDKSRKTLDDLHDKAIDGVEWGDRTDRNVYRLAREALALLGPHELESFEAANAGTIANLPVAMRANLKQHIERIGAGKGAREAA